MTAYQGGKQRIGKKIYDIIHKYERELVDTKLTYIEPFCGMCGVLRHFAAETDRTCIATDLNTDLILMWRAIQHGWEPAE